MLKKIIGVLSTIALIIGICVGFYSWSIQDPEMAQNPLAGGMSSLSLFTFVISLILGGIYYYLDKKSKGQSTSSTVINLSGIILVTFVVIVLLALIGLHNLGGM